MKHLSTLLVLAASSALTPAAFGQGLLGYLPFEHTGDLYVTDTTNDSIWLCKDLDYNGDYNGVGETSLFYSDAIGPFILGNNNGITVDVAGRVYVCDTSEDKVFRFVDADGNGNSHDPGEATIFFDGDPTVNLSGIQMVSPNDLTMDLFGVMYIAEANNGSGGIDSIIRLEDLNADGDANDLGEATYYYQPVTAGSTGDSIPNDVFLGADGHIYYVEGGSTGVVPKDVYRLDDANGDGFIDPLTEVASFFSPPAQSATPFFWSLTQDAAGYFYIADSGNELIWRFRDHNADNVIDPLTEASIWWQTSGSSLIWDLTAASDGSLYVAESQTPDRVVRMFDANGDGVIDPVTEVTEPYSDLLSTSDIGNPRDLIFEQGPNLNVGSPVPVGGSFSVDTRATVGDVVSTWWAATSIPATLIAPFGYLELSVFPGNTYGTLYTGVIGATGSHSAVFTLPSSPTLSGLSFYLQGFVGKPDRFQLTNLSVLTVL